ncbi:hypothetical protein [Pseudomonas serbica]|uniref:hypothetical protein n=1 Tax=Pseudomonas serbica TaxID=2965074 RepID=UPI00237A71C4|nr:hypothetical protein [Pseudomonas serbica]
MTVAVMNTTTINPARKYLDKAMVVLNDLGLKSNKEDLPVSALIAKIAEFGEDQALTISSVLARQGTFNEMARNQIAGMEIAERYEGISTNFNSIRVDSKRQLMISERGSISLIERCQNGWMNVSRGSIPKRFDKIKSLYIDVSRSMGDQIDRERRVIDAYGDYRFAMKAAESEAQILLANAAIKLEEAKAALAAAQEAVNTPAEGTTPAQLSSLELARDEKVRELTAVDDKYQVSKDMADQLSTGYNASEFVFARLAQTNKVKSRLYDQTVAFFATNEIVFTGISAATTANAGLVEGTRTINAMNQGVNDSLRDLASLGNKSLEAGIRAGYGSTIQASAMKELVDAVVGFQESSVQLISDLRKEATDNAQEVARIAEDGKRRFAESLSKVA